MSHAFDILGDPVRRRILELLADGQRASGEIVDVIAAEFAISQPAVSQHLRILRDSAFATSPPAGRRRRSTVADRKSVVEGKRVSDSVDLGARRNIKNK